MAASHQTPASRSGRSAPNLFTVKRGGSSTASRGVVGTVVGPANATQSPAESQPPKARRRGNRNAPRCSQSEPLGHGPTPRRSHSMEACGNLLPSLSIWVRRGAGMAVFTTLRAPQSNTTFKRTYQSGGPLRALSRRRLTPR